MTVSEEILDLSIVIVSYNTLELTRAAVQSIYDSTREISFEIFVVDNNSADGSPDALEAAFPKVKLIRNTTNEGLAAATNQGLQRSTGRYVLALNSDVIVRPGAFDTLVQFMDSHPDAGGATARLLGPDGAEHPPVCGNIPNLRTELLEALAPLSERFAQAIPEARLGPPIDYHKSQVVPCIIWGTALVVRKKIVDAIGGQDPRFYVYGEDVDWAMRIMKAGWKLYYVAEAEVIHFGGQSAKQASVKMLAQLYRSKCRLIQKHYGLLPGLVLRSAFAFVQFAGIIKWICAYIVRPSKRREAVTRISRLWTVIKAVLLY